MSRDLKNINADNNEILMIFLYKKARILSEQYAFSVRMEKNMLLTGRSIPIFSVFYLLT